MHMLKDDYHVNKTIQFELLFFGILIALEMMFLSRCNTVAFAFNLPSNCGGLSYFGFPKKTPLSLSPLPLSLAPQQSFKSSN